MNELMLRFAEFCEWGILAKNFDYIVPIETKGMLILNEAIPRHLRYDPQLLFRRAFDFFPPDSLKNKRIALVDDTVFLGRTISTSQEELEEKGAKAISKYAFVLCDDERYREDRQLEGINYDCVLGKREYALILEELSQLSLRERPSNPDHLIFRLTFKRDYPTERIIDAVSLHGLFVEYRRDEKARTCSVHYPSFSPPLPDYCDDNGANKLRMTVSYEGTAIRFSPELFPGLFVRGQGLPPDTDSSWRRIYSLLDRPWQSETVKLQNLYESFTLSKRIHLAENFLMLIDEAGLSRESLSLDTSKLRSYYGKEVTQLIEECVLNTLNTGNRSDSELPNSEAQVESEDVLSLDTFTLTKDLLVELDKRYRNKNASVSNRFKWKSAGMNISELSGVTGYSRHAVSVGIENLNDYGYAGPMFHQDPRTDGNTLQRLYRSTETGTARLYFEEALSGKPAN